VSLYTPYIDPAVPLSEHLTGLKFGLNPDVADPRVLPLMGAGMFSFSMGSNTVCLAATSTCLSCSSSCSPARPGTRMNNSCSMPGCPPSLGDLNHEYTPDRCRKEFVEGARITIRRTPRLREAAQTGSELPLRYRVLIEQDEDGFFVAEVPALRGCITQDTPGRKRSLIFARPSSRTWRA
jgi:hypothetical protein